MAVVKKQKKVVGKKVETNKVTPAKKTAEKKVTKKPVTKETTTKESTSKKAVTKKSEKPAPATKGGKKKMSLYSDKSASKSNKHEIKKGGQATQEAFIDKFHNKLVNDLGFDGVDKTAAKKIQKAYSETLREILDIASFQDTTAGIYYSRKLINTRVSNPPMAKDGLETLMLAHYELKVRKILNSDETIKYFGHMNDDGTFEAIVYKENKDGELVDTGKTVTLDIKEMEREIIEKYGSEKDIEALEDDEETPKKKKKTTTKKKATKKVEVEEEDEEEDEDEEDVVDDSDDEYDEDEDEDEEDSDDDSEDDEEEEDEDDSDEEDDSEDEDDESEDEEDEEDDSEDEDDEDEEDDDDDEDEDEDEDDDLFDDDDED